MFFWCCFQNTKKDVINPLDTSTIYEPDIFIQTNPVYLSNSKQLKYIIG
jgi:hypothetical protein